VTSIRFDGSPRAVPASGVRVPLRSVPRVEGEAQVSLTRSRTVPTVRPTGVQGSGWTRVGTVPLDSAARYLVAWAVGLLVVLVLVLLVGYGLLAALGVLGSVSRGLAVLLGEDLPSSGVLPVLQPGTVLPAVLVVSVLLSGLWLVAAFGAVLVHNAVTELTGGLRVRLRPDAPPTAPRPDGT
jgi:hypothetical protein